MAEKQSPFTPLDPSRRQIRLLQLEPDPSDLRATLEVVSLDDGPSYTALSYVWGTEICGADDGIALDGQSTRMPITRDLEVVLRHLCASGAARVAAGAGRDGAPRSQVTLWVDALCINQQDLAEKSHQITLMKDVYAGAEATCVWLGPAADDSDLAMATVGELYEKRVYVLPDGSLSEAQIRAVNALQSREWWSRIWVLQEVMLSRNPIVSCGDATLPFDAFVHLDDVRRCYMRPERRFLDNAGGKDRLVIRCNAFRHVLTDYPDYKPMVGSGGVPLHELLLFVDTFNATDQRDKIYGLLGLARPQDVHLIAPDYSKSVADVYARAAALFITQTQSLGTLQFDNDNKNPAHGLPSWCPDYSSDPGWPQRAYMYVTGEGYRAGAGAALCWDGAQVPVSGPSSSSLSSSAGPWREMRLCGLDVDAVERVGPNPYMPPYTGHVLAERAENARARDTRTRGNVLGWEAMALAKWAGGAGGGGDARFPYCQMGMGHGEAFWRTLMRDRQSDGSRVGPSFGRYFDVWLGRADLGADCDAGETEEARRSFLRPFAGCCIGRCNGRSFIVTEKGYIGTAPIKTCVGDKVVVLQGGDAPFIVRERKDDSWEERSDGQLGNMPCEFVGEAFVLGIMEGQAVDEARPEDTRVFVFT